MTFPMFLGLLFGVLSLAAVIAWIFARSEGGEHH
jgi:hypothetical protein